MLRRLDHVGVVVDDLSEARRFLNDLGLRHDRDFELPGRLRSSFFSCGETEVEVIEISEPEERALRLGSDQARIDHIAIEVDDLATTLKALTVLGVRTQPRDAVRAGANLSVWTLADSSDGVIYQLLQKTVSSVGR